MSGREPGGDEEIDAKANEMVLDWKIKQRAQEKWAAEQVAQVDTSIETMSLAQLMDYSTGEQDWLVEGLFVRKQWIQLLGHEKAGKLSIVVTLTKALVDGLPFLGRDTEGGDRVSIVNAEDTWEELQHEFKDAGIRKVDAVDFVQLRGAAMGDAAFRQRLAARLRKHKPDLIVFNTWTSLFTAAGLTNDTFDSDNKILLKHLREITAGVGENVSVLIVNHLAPAGETAKAKNSRVLSEQASGNWVLHGKNTDSRRSFEVPPGRMGIAAKKFPIVWDAHTRTYSESDEYRPAGTDEGELDFSNVADPAMGHAKRRATILDNVNEAEATSWTAFWNWMGEKDRPRGNKGQLRKKWNDLVEDGSIIRRAGLWVVA